MLRISLTIAFLLSISACATVPTPPKVSEPIVAKKDLVKAQAVQNQPVIKKLKRKVAIGRFTNETQYGRTFLRDGDLDPLGKQATDMLSSRLVESQGFLVFERPDLGKIRLEQQIIGQSNLIGVDTLIIGSVTEFGRSTVGQGGFLSATKKQIARAKVEVRLVDPKTAHVFFTATGSGEATTESGEVAGFGSKADYDETLNDKAIGAAVTDVMNSLISKLEERAWRTDILKTQGNTVFISGGERQGLKIGDALNVMIAGESVKSNQSGFDITLPPTKIASIRVISQFGDSESNEGSAAEVTSGKLPKSNTKLIVMESK